MISPSKSSLLPPPNLPHPTPHPKEKRKRVEEKDPLSLHIQNKGLPLAKRSRTPADGNCWYHAVADQVLHTTSFVLHISNCTLKNVPFTLYTAH